MCGNKIKTYSKGQSILKHHFFILSKGLNAEKPLTEPCPNCFVFHAETEQEKDFYYWLTFCLWQADKFKIYLVGSVIPFIRISDLKEVMEQANHQANQNPSEYQKSLQLLIQIDKQVKVIDRQLQLIKQAKKAIVRKVLK